MNSRITRREFVRTGLTGMAGLASVGPFAIKSWAARSEPIEALVIGTGFGGAVAALRLANAGVQTVMLEKGRRWGIPGPNNQDVFATVRNPDGRSTWLSDHTLIGDMPPKHIDVYTGVLQATFENGIIVSRGAGVGGGSLVYAAINYQPAKTQFDLVFKGMLDYDQMASVYYPRVRAVLNNPSPIPQDILQTPYYASTAFFIKGGQLAGLPTKLLDQNIDWNVVRQEIAGTRVRSAISGEFWYGNNSGCKNSLDRNYLARAERTSFLQILPLHQVTTIAEGPGSNFTVTANEIDVHGTTVAQRIFVAKHVFLAAGSMGTPELLVRAKAKGTLPKLNNNVGLFWGSNGDTLTPWLNLPPGSGDPSLGGPAGGVVEDFSNPLGPIIVENLARYDATPGSMFLLAMGIPPPIGAFTYEASTDTVKLNWPVTAPPLVQMQAAGDRSLNLLSAAVNKAYPNAHTFTPPTQGFLSAHPLGGAVMGQACDTVGRVLGYRGLYVVDGALIPGSAACTNPSFTIAAVAEHCMDHLLLEVAGRGPRL